MTSRISKSFVRAFGTMVGLVAVGYGAVLLFAAPSGRGPCRINCGFHDSVIALLGQPTYNFSFGLLWVVLGLALLVFLFFKYGRS